MAYVLSSAWPGPVEVGRGLYNPAKYEVILDCEENMFTCPWCGTSYPVFQPNCGNCGGPLPAPDVKLAGTAPGEALPVPPPAPRPISQGYAWRLLSGDGWAILAFVFGLLGLIFTTVGAGLTLGVITAFVGLPFLALGLLFLAFGGSALVWRYRQAQQIVTVLRRGEPAQGQIVGVNENYSVTVNGRHPWVIAYRFQANGDGHDGSVTTLNAPGPEIRPGNAVCILYLPEAPRWSSIYPHP